MDNKTDIKNSFEKSIQTSYRTLVTETITTAENIDTSLETLNTEAKETLAAYDEVVEKYHEIEQMNLRLSKDLLNASYLATYMVRIKKFLDKAKKLVAPLKLLRAPTNSVFTYIHELELLIAAYQSEKITIEHLLSEMDKHRLIFSTIYAEVSDLVGEYRNFEEGKNSSFNGSMYKFDTYRKSFLAYFKDDQSIYGTSTSDACAFVSALGNTNDESREDGYVYLTWPLKGLNNIKCRLIEDTTLLWFSYNKYYVGYYTDVSGETRALKIKSKNSWFGDNLLTADGVRRIEISTGYRVEMTYRRTTEVTKTNYKDYYVQDSNGYFHKATTYGLSTEYFKGTPIPLENITAEKLLTTDLDGDSLSIQHYRSYKVEDLSADRTRSVDTETTVVFDRDSFVLGRSSFLADSVDITIRQNGLTVRTFTLYADSASDGRYVFKGNILRDNDTESQSETGLPVKLTVTTPVKNGNTCTMHMYLEPDDDSTITLLDAESYNNVHYLLWNDAVRQSISPIDISDMVDDIPEIRVLMALSGLARVETYNSAESYSALLNQLGYWERDLTDGQEIFVDAIKENILNASANLNTILLAENLKQSLDKNYDSTDYSEPLQNVNTLYSDMSSYSDLTLEGILTKIDNNAVEDMLGTTKTTISSLDSLLKDVVEALKLTWRVRGSYEPMFGTSQQATYNSELITSTKLLVSIYNGSHAQVQSSNSIRSTFRTMYLKADDFVEWYNEALGQFQLSDDLLINYYCLRFIRCASSQDTIHALSDFETDLSAILLEILKAGDIQEYMLGDRYNEIRKLEQKLFTKYGVHVEESLNASKVPAILVADRHELSKINDYRILDLYQPQIVGEKVVEYKPTNHMIAVDIALYQALLNTGDIDIIKEAMSYLSKFLNIRTMITISEMNRLLNNINQSAYLDCKVYENEIDTMINDYFQIYEYYYGNNNNIFRNGIENPDIKTMLGLE